MAKPRPNDARFGQGRITITCPWCNATDEYTDSDLGRQMVNAWAGNHTCNDHRSPWRAA